VNKPPVAAFSVSPARPTVGDLVSFDGRASSDPDGIITDYHWTFGDGAQANAPTTTHTYNAAGAYTVTLTVTDDKHAVSVVSQVLTVTASTENVGGPTAISAMGTDPQGLAWDGTNLWEVDAHDLKLYQFSPSDGRVLNSIAVAAISPMGLAWDGQRLRLLESGDTPQIYTIDPASGQGQANPITTPAGAPVGLAWDGQNLWIADADTEMLYKIDPLRGQTLATVPSPTSSPSGLAWDGQYLWVADLDGKLYQVNPANGQTLKELTSPGPEPTGLTWDGQNLWVADDQDLKIYKIQP
jgi:PKD repeat protein